MKFRELRDGEPEIDDPKKEIEYEEDEYLPSEPGALDHGELAGPSMMNLMTTNQQTLEMKIATMIPNLMMT